MSDLMLPTLKESPSGTLKRYVLSEVEKDGKYGPRLSEIFTTVGMEKLYKDDKRILSGRGYVTMTVMLTEKEKQIFEERDDVTIRDFRPRL